MSMPGKLTAGFKGPTSKRRERGEGKESERKEGKVRREFHHLLLSNLTTAFDASFSNHGCDYMYVHSANDGGRLFQTVGLPAVWNSLPSSLQHILNRASFSS